MRSVKELVFGEGNYVALEFVENGELVYNLFDANAEMLLEFKVPPADQLGATFNLTDSPKMFMRWIRKELEAQAAEKLRLDTARTEWEKELAAKEGK